MDKIHFTSSSQFYSTSLPRYALKLMDIFLVPQIKIKDSFLSVSKFFKDNKTYFEFHPDWCYVKSMTSKIVLL